MKCRGSITPLVFLKIQDHFWECWPKAWCGDASFRLYASQTKPNHVFESSTNTIVERQLMLPISSVSVVWDVYNSSCYSYCIDIAVAWNNLAGKHKILYFLVLNKEKKKCFMCIQQKIKCFLFWGEGCVWKGDVCLFLNLKSMVFLHPRNPVLFFSWARIFKKKKSERDWDMHFMDLFS